MACRVIKKGRHFFGRGTSYTLDGARRAYNTELLSGATAGSERAPQGFMRSMQPTFHYHLLLRRSLCGAPLHGSWVLVVLKRALYMALSGAWRLTAPSTGQLKGRHFARGGGGRPRRPPWIRPWLQLWREGATAPDGDICHPYLRAGVTDGAAGL